MTRTDPSYSILRSSAYDLSPFLRPHSVAVIGATERPDSVGRTLLWNLLQSPFGGTVYPVNHQRKQVLGVRAFPSIRDIPDRVDLALIATPAATVPEQLRQCQAHGVQAAIILTAGFRESGPQGAALEQELLTVLHQGTTRVIGPNCLGVIAPYSGLNASFAQHTATPGHVAFLSQSGAICTSVLDWSLQEKIGFSLFASVGGMIDVDWGDLIRHLGDDQRTRTIILYVESIAHPRSFLSAAREVALTKPIIVIKPGRTEEASRAAASHTGALTGRDSVLDAAFRRAGVLRVDTLSELFDLAEVLGKQPFLPDNNRLAIITNAGGPGVIATDALIRGGGRLAPVSTVMQDTLNPHLPSHWSHANPIDILGDATPERYAKTLEVALQDPHNDAALVILTPQSMTDPVEVAERVCNAAQASRKPIIASWMGGREVLPGRERLNRSGIPNYHYPDDAVRLFNRLHTYRQHLKRLYETPMSVSDSPLGSAHADLPRQRVESTLDAFDAAQRTLLTEFEAKKLFRHHQIPVTEIHLATTVAMAVDHAERIGYPVVLKLNSLTISHKSDVQGVHLNLTDAAAVRRAWEIVETKAGAGFDGVTIQPMVKLSGGYELLLGASYDPQFGPIIVFGAGGKQVEIHPDHAIGLPPLTTTLAQQLMLETKVDRLLQGYRDVPAVDRAQLAQLLVRFSRMVVAHPRIREMEINPLWVTPVHGERPGEMIALDARVVLHDPAERAQLAPPAIRPYPVQYVQPWTLPDGLPILLRPIRPEDEPAMVDFHRQLSERSVYLRYFSLIKLSQRTAHERLTRMCFIDYDRDMALIAETEAEVTGQREILGVCRITRMRNPLEVEFALLIRDDYQRRGIGHQLLANILDIARQEGIHTVRADILRENEGMQRVCRKLGFILTLEEADVYTAVCHLQPPSLRKIA